MSVARLFLLMLSLLSISPVHAAPRHVRVDVLADANAIAAGGTLRLGLREKIAPGWHTYWINPGDSGQPLHVRWTLPKGFTMSATDWPAPERLQSGPLTSFGYRGEAVLLQTLTAPARLPRGPVTLKADIETLVCSDICVPEFDHLSVTLNGGAVLPALPAQAMPAVVQDGAFQLEDGRLTVSLPLQAVEKFAHGSAALFPYDWGMLDMGAQATVEIAQDRLRIAQKAGPLAVQHDGPLRMLVALDKTVFDVTAMPAKPAAAVKTPSLFAPREVSSLPAALILALLGGMILNLMPCVFPVLSMKALSLVRMPDKEKAHARRHGFAYTAGILLCFAAIAGALIVLKGAGAQIGWGFQLQTPQVVLALSWLLFAIGLSFSGLFEIGAGLMNTGGALTKKDGLAGSFCTGLLAAVVATPCTAPFMGAAVGYALVQPALVSLLVFLTLGFGLALPYLAICFSPALQRLLPRPGRWMVGLKEFLAFPMYASAAWLTWVYAMQTGADGVLYALSGMILLAMIVWLTVHLPGRVFGRQAHKGIVYALACAALAGLLLIGWNANMTDRAQARAEHVAGPPSVAAPEKFTPELLNEALSGADPVFVDMTAAWCITCKINEKVALGNPSVKALFRDRHMRYLVGDWTNQDASITAFLAQYGRQGVPLYVYYASPGANGQRPQPVILPQILTPNEVRKVVAP